MISVRGLRKHYQVHKRPPGLKAALRSLVHRSYTTVKAVDGISFDIKPGERVGFLGPNGAGKTTTLKVLAGLLHPSEGEVTVDGHVPRLREEAFLKKIMLVMGQKQQLLWDLPPSETFELNRAIYDVPRLQYKQTLDELVSLLELGDLIGKPTRQLSLGERMKCELAAALIHRPRVLFLDEPTIGLDVSMQVTMRAFIKAYNEQTGATLILTSHYMDDVAALCPRVIVIDKGQLSYDGSLDALVQRVRPEKRVVLRLGQPVDASLLASLGKVVSHEPGSAVLQVQQDAVNATVGRALSTLPVTDLTVENAPLEEVMSELFQESKARRAEAAREAVTA
ncbi:ATP-binding cassette domain-containing protein [Corallococcus sp. AB030]|uniref:ABC transporter ATP-binding protein n=1 Tax=Corallococcus TaxID=83461 RepID=UPI000EEC77CB|nr:MULTISPECIES: ATP-binding cassette domain-containing protein [Corallococcus]NPC73489.1 ATP-binding cassette domain-containing protein [Corallococcus exiguus]NPD25328.1 ATP-binding cassette domain-containing protein [Corallococcus exiguus]NRD47888.1 ATP-binding cassette domain-containing protein [Corallococcus exiguus]RKI02681.1 ATP-binding cassette domain-containing protein [Corallococcus sp. AB030]RUO88723.1 ATP-binding cassette domain-containing protein [Corallococcus sp. AB018]